MSKEFPVISVTGASGAVTPEVYTAFRRVLHRLQANPVYVQGDAFHRHNRKEMQARVAEEEARGNPNYSHFRPDANHLDKLEELFRSFGETGTGKHRYYVHTQEDADRHKERFGQQFAPGEITPWEDIPGGSDVLLYQGLHGMVGTEEHNVRQHVDLGIGVVPIINLEWIQKIERDKTRRGYTPEQVQESILRRMPDYVNHITPQFSKTDINFQRVPCVDTSNPFDIYEAPSTDDGFIVIRFRDIKKWQPDFIYLLGRMKDSFMSRRNTMVVPGSQMLLAMELVLEPIIAELLERRSKQAA